MPGKFIDPLLESSVCWERSVPAAEGQLAPDTSAPVSRPRSSQSFGGRKGRVPGELHQPEIVGQGDNLGGQHGPVRTSKLASAGHLSMLRSNCWWPQAAFAASLRASAAAEADGRGRDSALQPMPVWSAHSSQGRPQRRVACLFSGKGRQGDIWFHRHRQDSRGADAALFVLSRGTQPKIGS
jgi:hypothetical protein